MDAVSYSLASKQAQRIEKFIENPDSNSGVLTQPKVIEAGETVTIKSGRQAILADTVVDGDLVIEAGADVFVPAGAGFSDLDQRIDTLDSTKQDNLVVNDPAVKTALNASGTAPIYASRAWGNVNGTGTVAIRASGNLSSITDNGVGDYSINFITAMPDVNYGMSSSKTYTTTYLVPNTAGNDIMIGTKTTSSQRIYVGGVSGGNNVIWAAGDVVEINLNFYR